MRSLWILAALCGALVNSAHAQEIYEIDVARSNVHWLVYKAGAFARFGHNHVVSVGAMQGRVYYESELAAARFEMTIPVVSLVVDDPALRSGRGEEFASEPSADDIAGTKQNMLSEGVLNGEVFPDIRVTGTGLTALDAAGTLDITVELLGRSVELQVPTHVELGEDGLTASGEFSLQHAELGMEPFSVMMGALQVGEQLDFSYRVYATKIH